MPPSERSICRILPLDKVCRAFEHACDTRTFVFLSCYTACVEKLPCRFVIVVFSRNQRAGPHVLRGMYELSVSCIDAHMADVLSASEEDQVSRSQTVAESPHDFRIDTFTAAVPVWDDCPCSGLLGCIAWQQHPVHEPDHPCKAAAVHSFDGGPSPLVRDTEEQFRCPDYVFSCRPAAFRPVPEYRNVGFPYIPFSP